MTTTEFEVLLAALKRIETKLDTAVRPSALKFTQAAEALGVSTRHISRMVARGSLTVVDVGGARRIPMSEVQRLSTAPSMESSGATPEQVRFDSAAARARLAELRKSRGRR